MVDVVAVPLVPMITQPMQSDVLARLVIRTQVQNRRLNVQVIAIGYNQVIVIQCLIIILYYIIDSCQVNNGGCGDNAICSHDDVSDAVKCTCKIGFTNVGSSSAIVCKGRAFYSGRFKCIDHLFLDSCEVKNGGCDPNAVCSHDSKSNAVRCSCKGGYTNIGCAYAVVCKGMTSKLKRQFAFSNLI